MGFYLREGLEILKMAMEMSPLTTEAIKTEMIAKDCISRSLKANFAIKMATVNPIPADLPVAQSCAQEVLAGSCPNPELLAIFEKIKTPTGLPTTNPSMMAQATLELKTIPKVLLVISIPAFAQAKIGTITNALQG